MWKETMQAVWLQSGAGEVALPSESHVPGVLFFAALRVHVPHNRVRLGPASRKEACGPTSKAGEHDAVVSSSCHCKNESKSQ